jgi:hypothetical protein
MAGVFQNIDPPPPSPPGECVPPALKAGGGHTRWVERWVGAQYFGRRQAQLGTLRIKYFVVGAKFRVTPLLELMQAIIHNLHTVATAKNPAFQC